MIAVPPPTPSNPRSMVIQIVLVVGAIFAAGVLVAILLNVQPQREPERTISFRVEGSASQARITYTESSGKSTNPTYVSLPWQRSAIRVKSGTYVILTAGNPHSMGTLRCIIYMDGQEWRKEFTDAPEGKVACGGMVP